jgi:hypothetical protein
LYELLQQLGLRKTRRSGSSGANDKTQLSYKSGQLQQAQYQLKNE